jgi:hypothetical protein
MFFRIFEITYFIDIFALKNIILKKRNIYKNPKLTKNLCHTQNLWYIN